MAFNLWFLQWLSSLGRHRTQDQLLDQFQARSFGIAVSAVVADFASSIIKVPRELITQRMQTGHRSRYMFVSMFVSLGICLMCVVDWINSHQDKQLLPSVLDVFHYSDV